MSNSVIECKWEWPAGRKVETKLLLRVEKIATASKGWFGMAASPSLALPEATDVQALVLVGPDTMQGKLLKLQMPGMEARKLGQGKLAAAGLLTGNAVVVCIASSPAQEIAPAQTWLTSWNCNE